MNEIALEEEEKNERKQNNRFPDRSRYIIINDGSAE